MKITITKANVIQALAEEPLSPGYFAHIYGTEPVDHNTCKVCAVGAVLRRANVKTINSSGFRATGDNCYLSPSSLDAGIAEDMARDGSYMAALSCLFEGECERRWIGTGKDAPNDVREICIDFVTRHFPEMLEIDV